MVKGDDPQNKKPVAVEEKQAQDGVILGYLDALLNEVEEASNDAEVNEETIAKNEKESAEPDEPVDDSVNAKTACVETARVDKGIAEKTAKSEEVSPRPVYKAHVNSIEDLQPVANESFDQQPGLDDQGTQEERFSRAQGVADTSAESSTSIVGTPLDEVAKETVSSVEQDGEQTLTEKGRKADAHAGDFRAPTQEEWQQLDLTNISWHENGRPYWAQSRFDCLLFEVGNLILAAPLVELGCILKITQKFNRIVGAPEWALGIMQHANVSYRGVDSALVIMGNSYQAKYKDNLEFMITINESLWGLACHNIQKSVTLEPEKVRWRGDNSVKKWFAGTSVDYMCTVIDVAALAAQLDFNAK